MRAIHITADIVMGLILGLFLYAVVTRTWPSLQHPVVAVVVFSAALVVVLFRRPGGSLARKRDDRDAS